jgi:hypothetical protein
VTLIVVEGRTLTMELVKPLESAVTSRIDSVNAY